jgi:ribonuclease D
MWREDAARRHDSPPRSFVKDEILLDIARRPVHEVPSLDRVKGLPRPVEEEEGPNIVAAVAKGLSTPESDWPVIASNEETPRERFVSDSLWATVQAWCHGHGIDPALVTSRNEVVRFHRERKGEIPSKLLSGWRGSLLKPLLDQFLSGSAPIQMTWNGSALRARSS